MRPSGKNRIYWHIFNGKHAYSKGFIWAMGKADKYKIQRFIRWRKRIRSRTGWTILEVCSGVVKGLIWQISCTMTIAWGARKRTFRLLAMRSTRRRMEIGRCGLCAEYVVFSVGKPIVRQNLAVRPSVKPQRSTTTRTRKSFGNGRGRENWEKMYDSSYFHS